MHSALVDFNNLFTPLFMWIAYKFIYLTFSLHLLLYLTHSLTTTPTWENYKDTKGCIISICSLLPFGLSTPLIFNLKPLLNINGPSRSSFFRTVRRSWIEWQISREEERSKSGVLTVGSNKNKILFPLSHCELMFVSYQTVNVVVVIMIILSLCTRWIF